jgi:hypothetical protein
MPVRVASRPVASNPSKNSHNSSGDLDSGAACCCCWRTQEDVSARHKASTRSCNERRKLCTKRKKEKKYHHIMNAFGHHDLHRHNQAITSQHRPCCQIATQHHGHTSFAGWSNLQLISVVTQSTESQLPAWQVVRSSRPHKSEGARGQGREGDETETPHYSVSTGGTARPMAFN